MSDPVPITCVMLFEDEWNTLIERAAQVPKTRGQTKLDDKQKSRLRKWNNRAHYMKMQREVCTQLPISAQQKLEQTLRK